MRRYLATLACPVFLVAASAVALAAPEGAATRPAVSPATAPVSDSPGDGDRARREGPPRLTDQQETEVLEVIRTRQPERYAELMQLKEDRPEAYRFAIANVWRAYSAIRQAPPQVQDAFFAERAAKARQGELIRQIREAQGDQERIGQLRQELREALVAEFDASQIIRQHRLSTLEDQVKRLQVELVRRNEQREKIIDDQLARMTRPAKPASRPARPASRPATAPE